MNTSLIFIPLILIAGYLLLVRPQQQRVRRQQQLLSSISVGDQVVTAGGIVGRVVALDEERAELELAPGMNVAFLRQSISRRLEEPVKPPEGVHLHDGQVPEGHVQDGQVPEGHVQDGHGGGQDDES